MRTRIQSTDSACAAAKCNHYAPENAHIYAPHTVIRFVSTSAKFGIFTVVGLNGTLVEDEMRTFLGECEHFIFNKCPI